MKLLVPCMTCTFSGDEPRYPLSHSVDVRDDGRYEITCPEGHTSVTILQEQKFEVLFDIGAYAILDGYYREAVASFTSSLERFYEFFIKAFLYDQGQGKEEVDQAWKLVSQQSERQYGAYAFLYFNEFGEVPPKLPNSKVRFRNDVVHKGIIPTREQSINYGQSVLNVISPVLEKAKSSFPSGVDKTVFFHLFDSNSNKEKAGTLSIPTIISINSGRGPNDAIELEKALQDKAWWKARW